MADIKYTPEQLMSQSSEMTSIQSEFESLFKQTTNALNGMNESWSANLSSNFSGKIQTAQNSFSSIVNMLGNGAAAAMLGATSHSSTSIASFLESLDEMDAAIASSVTPKDTDSEEYISEQDLREAYDCLPESVKKTLGDFDTYKKYYEKFESSSLNPIKKLIEPATSAMNNTAADQYLDLEQEYDTKAIDCFKSGDIVGGIMNSTNAISAYAEYGGYKMLDTVTNYLGSGMEATNIPIIHGLGTALKNLM